ncbi:MAG: hypothetical protein AAB731_02545 [Patescibacteria group bacterium]
MGRLIDEARATTAAVEEENRQRQIREGVESERKKEKKNEGLARSIIERLPAQIMNASAQGARSTRVDFPDNNQSIRAVWRVEHWCEENSFQFKRSQIDTYDHDYVFCLEISWSGESSGK